MTLSLPNFKQANILVIGDIMLDRYWTGSTNRISPEAPVPVVKIGDIEHRLGGAANVAQNLATLGCQVSLSGVIGQDEAGSITRELLKENNIKDFLLAQEQAPTITKLRIMSRHQQLLRLDFEETLSYPPEKDLLEQIRPQLSGTDIVIISDYAKGTITNAQILINACKALNIPVLIDPKGTDFTHYTGATFLTPNRSELETIVGDSDTLTATFEKTEQLRNSLQLDGILVTLSEKGMALVSRDAPVFHMPTEARDVFDVTGAGDTVIATFAAALAAGSSQKNAMRLANVAAGVVVGKLGTSSVTAAELYAAIENEDRDLEKGSVDLDTLLKQVSACRQRGEKIVFTNGCFDILHAGHVRYLKQAAALGDKLIVAINSDAAISRLKGKERPIVPLNERMEVMSSLNCIDWVTPFDEDTPKDLIDAVVPDILCKGGDYIAEDIVGFDTVKKHGGETVVLPFVDGCSTSAIVDKIKKL